jgi:PKD repeat protein
MAQFADYTGNDNRSPSAVLNAFPTVVAPGQEVQLNATESSDPDGQSLIYHWDFGDGTTSNEAAPTHSFITK